MEIDDLPVEESRSIQVVEGFEGGFGNPASSGSEVPNDDNHQEQQQSPSRKRKLEAADEEESGSGPHRPALKLLHVEEELEQQHAGEQNNYPQSALTMSQMVGELSTASQILEENSAVAIEDNEDEGFIRNPHQSALEALLADEEDRSGNSCKESLSELIRSAVADEIPSESKYNYKLDFNIPWFKRSCGEHKATEMHANDPQSELEAPPHVLQSRVEDEPQLRISDPQSELGALPVEEEKFEVDEASEMRVDDNPQQSELVALPVEAKCSEAGTETGLEYPPQLELEALRVERNCGEDDTELRVDHHHQHHPQAELEALQRVEELMEEDVETTHILTVGDDPCSELGFVHDVMSAAQDVANVSVSDPYPDLETRHVVENSSGYTESKAGMKDHPRSDLDAIDVVRNEHVEGEAKVQQVRESSAAELEAPMEVGENNLGEDAQSPEKKRKMILLAAVAAFFSTLAGALGSIGELIGQLEKTAMGGVSEDRDGYLQRTGMEGMTSITSSSLLSESTALRLHSAMTRSSSSLRNNIVVSMFLLMQEHRKRTQKRPRELTGPWYIKPRSAQAIESFLDFSPQGDPEKFRELFRISPNLFFHICEMVRDEMLSDTPRSLRVLPNRVLTVERQVAIAIRRLATGNQFLGIADSFGVSKSTAVKVTWKFIVAFIKKARPLHLQWPSGEHMQQIKEGFRSQWGFPNCCGVVDGTHFTVEFPKGEDVTQYCDHQNHVSISMQAIVGHDQRFLDVVVGWPGSIQEYQLLQNTNFFRNVVITKERLNGNPYITQEGSSLREYVLGDGGYPLYDWLMVPYPSGLSAAKDEWNSRHAVARQCVEDALIRLKGTWRILSRILWKPRKERIGKMVFACCLLHNMIIERQDGLNPEVYAGVNPHPGGYTGVSIPTDEVFEAGPEAREVLFREVMGGGII